MIRNKRIPLKPGARSKVPLKHVKSGDNLHTIIAGSRITFNSRLNTWMFDGGAGGQKGTLQLLIHPGNRGEIMTEVPEEYQGRGIRSDLLEASINVAKAIGLRAIFSETSHPNLINSYKKRGWRHLGKVENREIFELDLK
ncbi:MAG: GNAT family N-acetyltransferase [archaeon]|nr:GNAT family N-acetyltransferase [archaeon]